MNTSKLLAAALLAAAGLVGCDPEPTKTNTPPSPDPAISQAPPKAPADNVEGRKFQLRNLAVQDLKVKDTTIPAWIMDTEAKRQEGMMFLKNPDVKDEQGMLFVFRDIQPATNGFWMHNTVLPLDIIYISAAGKVLNVQKGQPFDETSLPAKGAYKYTLELKQGQAKKLGIAPGTKIDIPVSVTASE